MALAPDSIAQGPWSLDGVDTERIGVDTRNDENGYALTVIVQPTTAPRDTDGTLSPMSPVLRHTDSKLSVASSSRSTVIDLAEDIRRGKRDLLVAEIEVGTLLAKSGCDIEILGMSLPASQFTHNGESVLPFSVPPPAVDLPFRVAVIALAPSVLQSASLDPTQNPRHLLRVTLPTSGYEPSIDDPLSSRTPPLPRPRWLLDLLNDGAVVNVSLKPRSEAGYRHLGQSVSVEDEKVGRPFRESKGPPRFVSRDTPNSTSLSNPLAVNRDFLPLPPAIIPPPVRAESNGDTASIHDSPTLDVPIPPPPPPPMPEPSKRYSFWKYPRLARFSTSAPTSVNVSPIKAPAPLTLLPEEDRPVELKSVSPTTEVAGTATTDSVLLRPVVSLPGLIVACILCLLLGSLLRSVLSEADFMVYPTAEQSIPPGEIRELRRLFQWKLGWGRDLVIAIARRDGA